MNNTEQKTISDTTKKYIALISLISATENRLTWSELFYLSMNIVVFLFLTGLISSLIHKSEYFLTYIDLALTFICIVIGMSINAYWVAFAMRTQLRLKLRHFQARFMERKLNSEGEYIFSDETVFFEPTIRQLKSSDNNETLKYPTSGMLRMDGFIGSAKPRYFSWLMPCMFIIVYWLLFFLILTKI